MLVALFILFNGWILYILMKPPVEVIQQQNKTENVPLQIQVASFNHEGKVIEVDSVSSTIDDSKGKADSASNNKEAKHSD